jgi:hypothetical protein
MTDFDEHELDKGFRRVVEGKSIEPPPSLWANIRITALERQLIGYQSAALWFKGTMGILAALLGGTGYLLYEAKNKPITIQTIVQKQIVNIIKTDTVYLTQTEKVYINRPIYVQATNPEINTHLTKHKASDDNITSNNTLIENNETDQKISTIGKPNNGKVLNKTTARFSINKSKNKSNKAEFTTLMAQNQSSNNFKNKHNSTTNVGKVLNLSNVLEQSESTTAHVVNTIDFLEPLSMQVYEPVAVPTIKYKLAQSNPKKTEANIPFIDRLSLSVYASPEWNAIDVRRNEPKAFNYGHEELQAGLTAGLRADVQVARKWSIRTGLEYSVTGFDDRNRRQSLLAENIDGRLGYLYRTALGTVEIPASMLSAQAQAGSEVGVEVQQPIQRQVLNIPFSVRYDIWAKPFRVLNRVPMKIKLYGFLGGYWQILLGQKGSIQIFEDSGRQFTSDLSRFQNSTNSYGINIGLGAELAVGRRFSLFIEPNFSKGISSVAKNMPIRSTISNFGTKIGLKWYLGRW